MQPSTPRDALQSPAASARGGAAEAAAASPGAGAEGAADGGKMLGALLKRRGANGSAGSEVRSGLGKGVWVWLIFSPGDL